ncbi:MAG: MmcQ/YjbR family DNA-binding protein [Kordiimonadaceae bacterium]|nr:MmcQ/YjbR family DNA-binding protein [Kordiimonadaceae bacterium]
MTRDEFNAFCGALKSATNVIQWGNSSVWKVGGKIFAISSIWGEDAHQKISFKCSDLSYQILGEVDGMVPAPYLARAKWMQVQEKDAMSDDDVKGCIEDAHAIIAAKLTKKLRAELGL